MNVNGVNFTGVAGVNPTATNYTSSNLPGVSNNDVNSVTGYSSGLAKDFIFGGFPETHNLSGLTPGKKYVFTLYTVGWNDGTRRVALIGGTGEGATVLNQDALGDNQGQRFEYEYTANAAGTATITAAGIDAATSGAFDRKSFHTYAISNREADPMVGVAPTITLQPAAATIGVGSDYTLRGRHVSAGDLLMLSYASANRDEEMFDSPMEFRVDRSPNRHVAFGFGAHACLGQNLARMEIRAFLKEFLRRVKRIELAGDCRNVLSNRVSGPKTLPLRFELA